VHQQLRTDQQREGQQEADVHVEIEEEWHGDAAQRLAAGKREPQEWEPRHDDDCGDAPFD
jgi:hypothetical protein